MRSNRTIGTIPLYLLAATLVAGSLLVAPARAGAAATPAGRCAAAKMKATGRNASDALVCHAKAVLAGRAVDPSCLAKAEAKLTKAFARAESRGGCFTTGDTAELDATVDAFVAEATGLLPTGPKRVFVTSTTTTGGFGGFAGGDAICAARASAAGLSGTYRAWLSTTTTSAADRLTHAAVPYERVDGTVIANDWADLVDGALNAPIELDEFGTSVLNVAWTSTSSDGALYPGGSCADWSSSSASDIGYAGVTALSNYGWSVFGYAACDTAKRLYCFEQ